MAKRAIAGRADLAELKKLSEKLPAATQTLSAKDTDPAANGIVGRYTLLAHQDWLKALSHLVSGDDEAMKVAAKADSAAIAAAEPVSADEAVGIANLWWDLGSKQTVPGLKAVMRHRASQWYDFALPNLKALAKTKAEQRLAESDWNRKLVVVAKAPLNLAVINAEAEFENLKLTFDAVHGMLETDFAICQSAKFDDVLSLTKKLAARQYRLTQIRPYPSSNGLQVAAIWLKDSVAGELFVGTAAEVTQRVETNRQLGFVPVDVAGFVLSNDAAAKYALVSAKLQLAKGIERNVELDIASSSLIAHINGKGVLPLTDQRLRHADGEVLSSLVVTKAESWPYSLWRGTPELIAEKARADGEVVLDLGAVIENNRDVRFNICSRHDKSPSAGKVSQILRHGTDLTENVAAWRKLAEQRARPVALGVCQTSNGQYHSMWIWQSQSSSAAR